MKNKITLLIILVFSGATAFGQTYITDVNVVDVIGKKLIPGQTVVITNDLISAVQPAARVKIPAGANTIDGKGKYLLPGLTDAHVHFFQSGGLYTRPDAFDLRKYQSYNGETDWVHNNMEDLLRRYLKAGITTVIDVGATYHFLQLRDSFSAKTYAPNIYMTGPLLTSYEPEPFKDLKDDAPFQLVTTVEEAKKMLQEQLPHRPDLIKIWYIVNPENPEASAREFLPVVKAIIEMAHGQKLKVAVHATERITAQLAVESGCDYLVHGVEDDVVTSEFLQLLKSRNVVLCPTLTVVDGYNKTFGQSVTSSFYELTNANPDQIGSLQDLKHLSDTVLINQVKKWINAPKNVAASRLQDSIRMVNLKKMSDAGITIVAGTDAGNIGTQHATSYLNELLAMQKSGMNNWQIIQSATINSAKLFGKEAVTGSIANGKKADMVLLDENPVDNLENIAKVRMVFNKGLAINPDTLVKETPLALVKRQLNAYNERNIDAFLEPYADDVELYEFPNKLIAKGKDAMRKDYGPMFKEIPELHCEIKERIIQGNIIIDKESVSGFGQEKLEATAIYHIENNKIRKVYFIQ